MTTYGDMCVYPGPSELTMDGFMITIVSCQLEYIWS